MLGGLVQPLESPITPEPLPAWLLPHQADAVERARAILNRFNGVLLADGVGLGKTYLGLALMALESRGGGRAVAVMPPSLKLEWTRAGESTGVPVTPISHTQLLSLSPRAFDDVTLLVVDEAHAFRNPNTARYGALARLAVGRRVALLTATPYNNAPRDLDALIRLFAPSDTFRELGIADLGRALATQDAAAALALGAVTVCRSRRLVEQRFPEMRGRFPKRELCAPVRYDLDAAYGGRLADLLALIGSLAGSAPATEQAASLMQLGLLKRLESSRAAFRRTLLRHMEFLEEVMRAGESGVRISRSDYRALFPRSDGDDSQLVMWPVLKPASRGRDAGIERDQWRAVFAQALDIVDSAAGAPDAKQQALESLLLGPLAGIKTIVFTEYRDTALDLLRRLRGRLRVIAVAGADAWAGIGSVTRDEALDAFAPDSRGSRRNPLMEADVLIATDVAGAGLNLQDAGAVVNYDLPWNPVRIMQRIGRVDRLDSPHRRIAIAHLQPVQAHSGLAAVLRTLRTKLAGASALPGSEPDPLAALWWVNARLDGASIEHESWRRIAPFEARERWRMIAGGAGSGSRPVIAGGLVEGAEPAAGVLLAITWSSGHRVPLPFVITASGNVVESAELLGELAERALAADALPVDAASFASALSTVLPVARRRLIELSGNRFGASPMGPGQRDMLDMLQREWDTCRKYKFSYGDLDAAIEHLETSVIAGLELELGDLGRRKVTPMIKATGVRILFERLLPRVTPHLRGTPRLDLLGAIVLATKCPA